MLGRITDEERNQKVGRLQEVVRRREEVFREEKEVRG
jgi:hypothetical protein